jgi:hypothetical protein
MKEPLLFNKETNKETYRFTWLRTFHEPVVIRIEKEGNTYKVFWKETNGAGGYEPGKLTVNQSRKIDKKDWDMFIALLDSVNYWNMKTNFTDTGNDGAIWILEASTPEQYYVVNRWSPGKKDKFHIACNFLIELTDLEIIKKY